MATKDEPLKIRKDRYVITNERYKTPRSVPMIFHFDPYPYESVKKRLKEATILHEDIDGGDVYIVDRFFADSEGHDLRNFTKQAEFKKMIYAEHSSKEKGEEPARAMDNKEKWQFFSKPPHPVDEIFKFLSYLADKMEADITTLPWELYDENICAPTFATNLINHLSKESEDLGKHDDYDTEEGISFGIPVLYEQGNTIFPNQFVNGDEGNPWLITLMLYGTSEDFKQEYGLGSVFCKKDGSVKLRSTCKHMRFVLFEGNIIHGIAQSNDIPDQKKIWRVSYVLKLVVNPKNKQQSMKKKFYELMQPYLG